MQIEIVFYLLITAVCGTAAICLMAGHAIGYRKAEKYWMSRIARKAQISSAYGKPVPMPNQDGKRIK